MLKEVRFDLTRAGAEILWQHTHAGAQGTLKTKIWMRVRACGCGCMCVLRCGSARGRVCVGACVGVGVGVLVCVVWVRVWFLFFVSFSSYF